MTDRQFQLKEIGNFRYLLLSSAIMMFLLTVVGGMLRVSNTAGGCPDWPTCYGRWLPPIPPEGGLDYGHRILSFGAAVIMLGCFLIAWRHYRNVKMIFWPVAGAMGLTIVQGLVGGIMAREGLDVNLSAIHFGMAMAILGLSAAAAVTAFNRNYDPDQRDRLVFQSPFSKMARSALVIIFAVLVSGVVLSQSGTITACDGWPLCNGKLIPDNPFSWINFLHRVTVAVGGLFMFELVRRSWQSQRSQRAILTAATTTGVLYFAQGFVGGLKATREFPVEMLVLHEATAAAVLVSAVVMYVFVGLAGRSPQAEAAEAQIPVDRVQRRKDFLALTKPIIVVLLLVTTFAGMIIGAKAIPSGELIFWTMLGGALAAGGAGAVNQYIDRELDQRMKRTASRPLPAGRMTAAEGLAFGVGMLLTAFYIMAGFVNMLAALLSLAGMIYYVLIYSIFLKKTTVQNIVIGGGAGAIPPMVGIAATTGQIDLISIFLFAIVFMWTPPHFWALALIRQKDYANAGIPMLPVVRGEAFTRRQILIYTVELVAVTILMAVLNLAGRVYLAFAIVLGVWMLVIAWQVWRQGGNKIAYRMYRHSSYYLLLLFAALAVDALV